MEADRLYMDTNLSCGDAGLVSVIVPCFNEAGHIGAFLDGLLEQQLPPGMDWEAVIADGMSDDGTREILRRFCAQHPRVRMIDNPQRFVPAGLNAAIAATRGAFIVRMDVHTTYARDYLAQCLKALQDTGAEAVGGPWVAVGRDYVSSGVALAFNNSLAMGGGRAHDPDYCGPVDTVYLGCWQRLVFMKYGLFDEDQIRNEDEELNVRIRLGGGRVWQTPAIESRYTVRSSFLALCRQYIAYGYWKIRNIKKHRRLLAMRHLVPGVFVLGLFLLLPLALVSATGRLGLAVIGGSYIFYLITTSVLICSSAGAVRHLPIMPAVLTAMQLGYGYGSLRGIFDFMIAGRREKPNYTGSTR